MVNNWKNILKAGCFAVIAAAALSSCGRKVELYEYNVLSEADNKEVMTVSEEQTIRRTETTTSVTGTTETTTTVTTTDTRAQRVKINKTMPSGYPLPDEVKMDFETVLQNPELPTGCEITSLAQTLRYWKYDIDKVTLSDNYLNIDLNGIYSLHSAFIGDPHTSSGMGCNANVLVDAANEYFGSIGSDWRGMDLTGVSFDTLLFHLAEGRPVVTVVTLGLMDSKPQQMYTTVSGEQLEFTNLQHCMTMYGYDKNKNIIYTADPMRGNVEYNMDQYRRIYDAMGKQAMVVYGDGETAGKSFRTQDEIADYIEDMKERRAEIKSAATSVTSTTATTTVQTETTVVSEKTSEVSSVPATVNVISIPSVTTKKSETTASTTKK